MDDYYDNFDNDSYSLEYDPCISNTTKWSVVGFIDMTEDVRRNLEDMGIKNIDPDDFIKLSTVSQNDKTASFIGLYIEDLNGLEVYANKDVTRKREENFITVSKRLNASNEPK